MAARSVASFGGAAAAPESAAAAAARTATEARCGVKWDATAAAAAAAAAPAPSSEAASPPLPPARCPGEKETRSESDALGRTRPAALASVAAASAAATRAKPRSSTEAGGRPGGGESAAGCSLAARWRGSPSPAAGAARGVAARASAPAGAGAAPPGRGPQLLRLHDVHVIHLRRHVLHRHLVDRVPPVPQPPRVHPRAVDVRAGRVGPRVGEPDVRAGVERGERVRARHAVADPAHRRVHDAVHEEGHVARAPAGDALHGQHVAVARRDGVLLERVPGRDDDVARGADLGEELRGLRRGAGAAQDARAARAVARELLPARGAPGGGARVGREEGGGGGGGGGGCGGGGGGGGGARGGGLGRRGERDVVEVERVVVRAPRPRRPCPLRWRPRRRRSRAPRGRRCCLQNRWAEAAPASVAASACRREARRPRPRAPPPGRASCPRAARASARRRWTSWRGRKGQSRCDGGRSRRGHGRTFGRGLRRLYLQLLLSPPPPLLLLLLLEKRLPLRWRRRRLPLLF